MAHHWDASKVAVHSFEQEVEVCGVVSSSHMK